MNLQIHAMRANQYICIFSQFSEFRIQNKHSTFICVFSVDFQKHATTYDSDLVPGPVGLLLPAMHAKISGEMSRIWSRVPASSAFDRRSASMVRILSAPHWGHMNRGDIYRSMLKNDIGEPAENQAFISVGRELRRLVEMNGTVLH